MALPRAGHPIGLARRLPQGHQRYTGARCLLSSQRMWHDLKPWIVEQCHGYFGHLRCLVGGVFDNKFEAARVARCGMGTPLDKRRIRFAQAINARVLAVMQQRGAEESQIYERKKPVFIAKISEMISARIFTIILLYQLSSKAEALDITSKNAQYLFLKKGLSL